MNFLDCIRYIFKAKTTQSQSGSIRGIPVNKTTFACFRFRKLAASAPPVKSSAITASLIRFISTPLPSTNDMILINDIT